MSSLPRAFFLAIAQLGDRAILRVLAKSAAITVVIFVALGWGASFGFDALLARFGITDEGAGTLLAVLATVIGAWLLFRLVALAVVQFFADDIVRAVEARYYPEVGAQARPLPLHEELSNSVRATARAVLVNLAVMPVAIFLLVTGVGTALLFWAVNAVLLGRELMDMVWLRHRPLSDSAAPLGAGTRFALGGVVAALLIVPFINSLAPVIGAAAATHLVHRSRRMRA